MLHGAAAMAQADSANGVEFRALFSKARELSRQGNLREAVRFYKEAYEVRAEPELLYNIARLLHKMGRFQESGIYYQLFLDSPLDDEEQKRKAREYLEQLKGKQPASRSEKTVEPSSAPTRIEQNPPTEDGAQSVQNPRPSPSASATTTAPFLVQDTDSTAGTPTPLQPTPLYRKWWLWTIVGGVVVAGAVGLGVGLTATKPGGLTGPSIPGDAYQYTPVF